jgi:hypothetical protein
MYSNETGVVPHLQINTPGSETYHTGWENTAEDHKKEGIWTVPLQALVLRLQWDDSSSKFVVHKNEFELS